MAGIYIHVPFCKTRCNYCDFFTGTDKSPQEEYIAAVCNEIRLRKDYLKENLIHTIYFGGGTPSQLGKANFRYIFESIFQNFDIATDAEITLEANPDDLNEDYLKDLQSLPFNRISIGIQSFDDNELHFLNRRHSAQKAITVVEAAKKHGFSNISIDLMYGLPNQTLEIWEKNIKQAISLDVQHISAYHLIYEKNTPLFKICQEKQITPIDEELSLKMFSSLINKLSNAGFIHYEISNFGKENFFSRHNTSYWTGKKYLGIGPAAHSYNGEDRAWNIASVPLYIDGIKNNIPVIEIEKLETKDKYNDFILTGMRTMWGIDLLILQSLFGSEMLNYCMQYAQKHIQSGMIVKTGNQLRLTPKGIFISDNIMSDLMFV